MLSSSFLPSRGVFVSRIACLRLAQVTGMTLDNVELQFDAAICIRVTDAQKAVTSLASGKADRDVVEEMFENVQERAKVYTTRSLNS